MNIYSYLETDHKKVENLFTKIISTKNKDKRKLLFKEVAAELLLHAETEHETFYNALKQHKETHKIIEHADKEHEEVKKLITAVKKNPTVNDKWLVELGGLRQVVTHHVSEEEKNIFKKAKKILNSKEAKQLAIDMENLKQKVLSKSRKRTR
jgi:hemerythrin superfamily protein